MKKKLITFIFVFVAFVNIFAQSSYRFKGEDIRLDVDSSMCFIQTVNEQLSINRSAKLNQQVQEGKINSFHKISNNGFLIIGNKIQDEQVDYFSQIYRTKQKDIVIILPRLVVSLKEGTSIKDILNSYSGKLDIESGNSQKYILKCNLNKSDEVLKLVNELTNRIDVDWSEPELMFEIKFYNTFYPQQYYLNNTGQNGGTAGIDINVVPAWDITNGSSNIKIAVIDNGVDKNHEDMGNRVLDGYTIGNSTGLGAPQNANILDPKGHGMACAGIIAATNNTIGIRGIASKAQIIPVNIAPYLAYQDNSGNVISYGTTIEIAKAINWAWHRADILSNSWGVSYSSEIESAIDSARTYGRNGKGSIVVFASGNYYPDIQNVSFPGNVNGVITVGAINKNGTIWNYSQRGASMDLVAPSGDINLVGDVTTTDRMGNLGYNNTNYMSNFGGTSAACPQVAGVAALMLSVNPDLTESQVRTTLQNTARDLGAKGFDNTYGYGLVDAYAAVYAVAPRISGPSQVCSGEEMTFTISNSGGATIVWSQDSNVTRVSPQGSNPCTFTCADDLCSISISPSVIIDGISDTLTQAVSVGRGYYNSKDFSIKVYETSTGQLLNAEGPECLCANTMYDIVLENNGNSQVLNYDWTIPSYWMVNQIWRET